MTFARFFALTGAGLLAVLFPWLLPPSSVSRWLLARFLSRPLAQVFNRLLAWFLLVSWIVLRPTYREGPSSFPCSTPGSVSCSTPCSDFWSTASLVIDRQSGCLLLTFSVFCLIPCSVSSPSCCSDFLPFFFREFYSLRGVQRQSLPVFLLALCPLLALAGIPGSRFYSFSPDILVRLFLYTLRALRKL